MTTKKIGHALAAVLSMLLALHAHAAPISDTEIPAPLKPWVPWVLYGEATHNCPLIYNDSEATRLCSWSSRLGLSLQGTGGRFTLEATRFAPGWIVLPGDDQRWPLDVKANGAAAPVVAADEGPAIYLAAGTHHIEGTFSWKELPESLPMPAQVGLVSLSVDGQSRAHPLRGRNGELWLGKTSAAAAEIGDHLSVKVFRLIDDDIPLRLTTHLNLEVGGKVREAVLGPVLPADFIPLSLSGGLPARLDEAGKLHVQLRPGVWTLELAARSPAPVAALKLPTIAEPWPTEEIWSLATHNDLRVIDASGAPPVDPRQTELPAPWRSYPAFQMTPDTALQLTERQRGNAEAAPDRVTLRRTLWLDFNGTGYTVQDTVSGQLHRHWRLEAAPLLALGQVTVDGEPQLITHNPRSGKVGDASPSASGDETGRGVEVRGGNLVLRADSRVDSDTRSLPVSGWNLDFANVSTTLWLPPGWRLLATRGADNLPQTWISRWTLLDLFVVMIVSIAALRLFGHRCGALTLFGLVLIWHEPNAPHWTWLNLIVASALLKALPDAFHQHTLMHWLRRYTWASAALLVILALPFAVQQARWALYPQLEVDNDYRATLGIASLDSADVTDAREEPQASAAPENEPVPAPPAPPEHPAAGQAGNDESAMSARKIIEPAAPQAFQSLEVTGKRSRYDSFSSKSLKKMAPNALTQTGPGLPNWTWNSVQLSWTGPVTEDQQLQLWLLPPWMTRLWRVLSILMIVAVVGSWLKLKRPHDGGLVGGPGGGLGLNLGIGGAKLGAAVLAIGLSLLALGWSGSLQAQSSGAPPIQPPPPDQAVLDTLKSRLLAAPDCAGACADTARLGLSVSGETLTLRLGVDALADAAVPLPVPALAADQQTASWQPATVVLDGHDAALTRREDGALWVIVNKGRHDLVISGALAGLTQLQLPLTMKPHHVDISAAGWLVSGIEDDGRVGEALQLARIQTGAAGQQQSDNAAPSSGTSAGAEQILPRFLIVTRTLHLGQSWDVATSVQRLGAASTPDVVQIPVLPGEVLTSEGLNIKDGTVQLSFAANQTEVNWASRLPITATLALQAASSSSFVEIWELDISPLWHVESSGIPPVQLEAGGYQRPRWQPWPSETVALTISRPQGVAGQVLTLDSARLDITPGQRASEATLSLRLRASQGGQHVLTLPADATLQKLSVDNLQQPPRLEGQKLTLSLHPGRQNIVVQLRLPQALSLLNRTPDIDLGLAGVNAQLSISMPASRWVLFLGGPSLGPAVLFWGALGVLMLVAIGLGRTGLTPLKTVHWMLLLIGLSQIAVWDAALVIGFWLALGVRERVAVRLGRRGFNLLQLALLAYALLTFALLFQAVAHGLLGQPDMQITGNRSYGGQLHWYQDRYPATLPQAWVLSVSIWVYRLLMLAWALWLANALIGWLRWGWERFSAQGLWKRREPEPVSTPPVPPPPMPPAAPT